MTVASCGLPSEVPPPGAPPPGLKPPVPPPGAPPAGFLPPTQPAEHVVPLVGKDCFPDAAAAVAALDEAALAKLQERLGASARVTFRDSEGPSAKRARAVRMLHEA